MERGTTHAGTIYIYTHTHIHTTWGQSIYAGRQHEKGEREKEGEREGGRERGRERERENEREREREREIIIQTHKTDTHEW